MFFEIIQKLKRGGNAEEVAPLQSMLTDAGGLATMRREVLTKDLKPCISLQDSNHTNPSQKTKPTAQSDQYCDKKLPTSVVSVTTDGAATAQYNLGQDMPQSSLAESDKVKKQNFVTTQTGSVSTLGSTNVQKAGEETIKEVRENAGKDEVAVNGPIASQKRLFQVVPHEIL